MRPFQISRYIKKYTVPIVAVSLLAGIALYFLASMVLQSYVAKTVIKYPDGVSVDTSEIYASNIVSDAMDSLGMDKDSVNTDYIRNHIKVTPIVSEDEAMLKEAVINQGEQYTGTTSAYLVTYTANVSEGREFARTMLNEILDTYLTWYGETYENTSGGANTVSDIYDKDYDYIEMMEIVDDFLDSSMKSIDSKIAIDDTFRSYASGYSFSDLYNEFSYIKDNDASGISADILNDKITKNRDVLLSKYNKRNSDMTTKNAANQEEIDKIKGIINSYVSMMSESGNTNITHDYILNEVYDNTYTDENGNVQQGDTTVQYDRLLDGYVADREDYENNLLDIAYNQYVIETFTGAAQVSSDALQTDIRDRISALVTKLNELYDLYDVTNDEFNEYLGATQITMLSNIGVTERLPVATLTILTVLVFGVLGCGGAVVLGRVGDVMDYYAFTDKLDGLPNRAKCDNFLAEREDKLLFGDYSAVVLRIRNLRDVNAAYGRKSGDEMLKSFVHIITAAFVPSDEVFVGNNGSGQYLIFAKGYSRDKANEALMQIAAAIEVGNRQTEYKIEYEAGLAEASSDKCYNIRKLLSLAMKDMSAGGNDSSAGTGSTQHASDRDASYSTAAHGNASYGNASYGNAFHSDTAHSNASFSDTARSNATYSDGSYSSDSHGTSSVNTDESAKAAVADTEAADTEKKVVNYNENAQIFTLGSDYYSKFRDRKNKH